MTTATTTDFSMTTCSKESVSRSSVIWLDNKHFLAYHCKRYQEQSFLCKCDLGDVPSNVGIVHG